jgi:hypothetical protein
MTELDIAISAIILGPRATKQLYNQSFKQQRKCLPVLLKRNDFTKYLRGMIRKTVKTFGVEYAASHMKLSG